MGKSLVEIIHDSSGTGITGTQLGVGITGKQGRDASQQEGPVHVFARHQGRLTHEGENSRSYHGTYSQCNHAPQG